MTSNFHAKTENLVRIAAANDRDYFGQSEVTTSDADYRIVAENLLKLVLSQKVLLQRPHA